MSEKELDARIEAALGRKPRVEVPPGFAARVALAAAAQSTGRAPRVGLRWGARAAIGCVALQLVLLFAAAWLEGGKGVVLETLYVLELAAAVYAVVQKGELGRWLRLG